MQQTIYRRTGKDISSSNLADLQYYIAGTYAHILISRYENAWKEDVVGKI